MVALGDLSPGAQITIGVCVGVLSTSVQSLGLTLQRKSHLLEDDRPPHVKKRPPHRRRLWQVTHLRSPKHATTPCEAQANSK